MMTKTELERIIEEMKSARDAAERDTLRAFDERDIALNRLEQQEDDLLHKTMMNMHPIKHSQWDIMAIAAAALSLVTAFTDMNHVTALLFGLVAGRGLFVIISRIQAANTYNKGLEAYKDKHTK